jgi:hypothetical protein
VAQPAPVAPAPKAVDSLPAAAARVITPAAV